MFKIEELSGHLIKSGRFKEAIPKFYSDLKECWKHGCLTHYELMTLTEEFSYILLNPSDYEQVQQLGNKMIALVLRIPDKVPTCSPEEFEKNVKRSREAN